MPSKTKKILKPEDELKLVKKILKRDYLVNLAEIVALANGQAVGVEAYGSVTMPKSISGATTVEFQSAPFDSSGFLPGGTGTCLTVPAHLGGRYDFVASARWTFFNPGDKWKLEHAHAGYFHIKVYINGSGVATNSLRNTTNATIDATGTTQNQSWHLNLEAGDTLEVLIQQSVHQDPIRADVEVCMTRLGAVS